MQNDHYIVVKNKFEVPPTRGFQPLLIDILGMQEDSTMYLEVGDILEVDGTTIFVHRGENHYESINFTWILDEWVDNGCIRALE